MATKKRTSPKTLLLSLGIVLIANTAILACSCGEPVPVLDQFERSEFVFTGRLTMADRTKAVITVERTYKGKLKAGETLDFVNGGHGDCSRGYRTADVGREYLFYLSVPTEGSMFNPSLCSRSTAVERAFDDLSYLNKLPATAGRTRLSGYFISREENIPNVEGLVITVSGTKRQYELTTDKNGLFEVYDLAPGDYIVTPQIPIGWQMGYQKMSGINNNKILSYELTVKSKRHTATRIPIFRTPVAHYPRIWFAPINDPNKPDWEILPQEAKAGEVILSKRNELGILSNFAATPFEMDGKRYASVEGFWQMMLYPEEPDDPRAKDKLVTWKYTREQVAQMTAFEAKAAGTLAEENMKTLGIDWCTFEGKRFLYRSATPGEHYKLILAAMRAKADQNPKVKRILLATGDLILKPDHHGEENPPPEWLYNDIWMQIRKELTADKRK